MATSTKPLRLHEIDALRGLAALGVVIFHTKMLVAEPGGVFQLTNALGRIANGYLWTLVDLFFVISGFVFAHVYLDRASPRLRSGVTGRSYAVARVARLYPLHLLTLVFVGAMVWFGPRLAGDFASPRTYYDGYHFILNLFFLEASGLERGFSFNSPAWSLSAEVLCYGLFYLLAKAGPRALVAGSAALIVLGFVSIAQPALPLVPVRLARGLIGFFLGVLVYQAAPRMAWIPAWALAAAVAVMLVVNQKIGAHWHFNSGARMSLLVWPLVLMLCMRGWIADLLGTLPMRFLGDLSYSTYLTHVPIAMVLVALNGGELFHRSDLAWLAPVFIGAVLLVSWISYTYLERPANQRLRALGHVATPSGEAVRDAPAPLAPGGQPSQLD